MKKWKRTSQKYDLQIILISLVLELVVLYSQNQNLIIICSLVVSIVIGILIFEFLFNFVRPNVIISEDSIVLSNYPGIFLATKSKFIYRLYYSKIKEILILDDMISIKDKNGKYYSLRAEQVDNIQKCSEVLKKNIQPLDIKIKEIEFSVSS